MFGSATLIAFLIQVVTGIALATAYVSSAGEAFESLQWITHRAFLGNLLRGMHYFGASAMVLLLGHSHDSHVLDGILQVSSRIELGRGCDSTRPHDSDGLHRAVAPMGSERRLVRTIVAAEQAGRVPLIGPWLARFLLGGQTVGGATLSRFFAYHVLHPGHDFRYGRASSWLGATARNIGATQRSPGPSTQRPTERGTTQC